MLSNLERIALMRERTKRARERLDKLEAIRKHELARDEATEFCRTVQDWHVYLWRLWKDTGTGTDSYRAWYLELNGPGKRSALKLTREYRTLPYIGHIQDALEKSHQEWKASRRKPEDYRGPRTESPEGLSFGAYTNSPDFNEDQRRKRMADSIAETVTILIIAAVGYAFFIA